MIGTALAIAHGLVPRDTLALALRSPLQDCPPTPAALPPAVLHLLDSEDPTAPDPGPLPAAGQSTTRSLRVHY